MKVTDEMVTAYAVAFDTAKGRTTERRRKAIQAVLDLGLGEMTKTTIDTLTQEISYLREIVSRYEPERSFDYDYPDPAAVEGRT